MKKGIIWSIIVVILVIVGVFGYRYYSDTYKAELAYARTSNTIPPREKAKDSDGKVVSGEYAYQYTLKFVKMDGSVQMMSYELDGSNPKPFKPNSYVKADISKNRVVQGPNAVSASEVPSNVKAKLK